MANIFITSSAFFLCVHICIPSASEQVDPIHNHRSELGSIVQWSSNNHQEVELYQVPLMSLDRLNQLAKVKENEVSILFEKQLMSKQFSDEVEMISEFQEENAKSLIKLHGGLWVSMTMDCYRNMWMRKLHAFQAKMKRMSILPNLKTLQWIVQQDASAFAGLTYSTFKEMANYVGDYRDRNKHYLEASEAHKVSYPLSKAVEKVI